MTNPLTLSPRYRLDDEFPWLEGIDPARNYWIAVNGDAALKIAIGGLFVSSYEQWKHSILKFRALQAGEQMDLVRISSSFRIHCISSNCYAIEGEVASAPVWHLFDQETLDSLLMSAHPDWQCAPTDIDLGRQMLSRSWEQEAVV
ncbi:MAG: hypothetical protein F6K58_23485 [Symploca sp. SIO2E9]|nr:hypothetical protein [Symploca sp. SIO2E9]